MAPKVAVKRAAEVSSPKRAKKARCPVTEQCDAVVEALEELTQGLSKSCLTMLVTAAPKALKCQAADRHASQQAIVGMIGETFNGITVQLQGDVAAKQQPVDAANEVKAGLDATAAQKESEHEVLKGNVATAKELMTVNTSAVLEAGQALKAAKHDQEQGDASLNKAESKKQELETTLNDTFAPLKEKAAEGKDSLKTLHKVGKKYGFEGTLLSAIDTIFAKAPAERGSFDTMVVTQYEDSLKSNIATLSKELEEGDAGKMARAGVVAAAAASKEQKEGALEASKNALTEAITLEKGGKEALSEAKKEVHEHFPNLKIKMNTLDEATKALNAFREGALGGFQQLKELAPAVEAPPAEQQE